MRFSYHGLTIGDMAKVSVVSRDLVVWYSNKTMVSQDNFIFELTFLLEGVKKSLRSVNDEFGGCSEGQKRHQEGRLFEHVFP